MLGEVEDNKVEVKANHAAVKTQGRGQGWSSEQDLSGCI